MANDDTETGEGRDAQLARLVLALRSQGVTDPGVLAALESTPRELFTPDLFKERAFEDSALPIACGQTISQPFIVGLMSQALQVEPRSRVLEIGTGSGYQAAILAALGLEVFTVERIGALLRGARKRFRALGLQVRSKHDDGRIGWPEEAPFDAIIVTAAGAALVEALLEQLAPGGVLVAPVGASGGQALLRLRKSEDGTIHSEDLGGVSFVPLLSGIVDR